MIIFLLFVSLFAGINIKFSPVLGIVELVLVLAFTFFKVRKKTTLLLLFVALLGCGLSFIRPTSNKSAYEGVVCEVKENYFIFQSGLEKFYISEPNNYREIGDILLIEGNKKNIDFPVLESSFDFNDYLYRKGVYSEISFDEIKVKFANPLRIHKVKKDFLMRFDENSRGLISTIMFAYSGKGETIELGQDLHLMRLVSSSGIYLYFLYKVIKKLIYHLTKKEKISNILPLILLVPYLIFTFPKFIVIKFFVVRILMVINEHLLKKKYSYLELVSFSGIVFLLLDYHLARQDGFFLTYFIPILVLFINNSCHFRKKKYQRLFVFIAITISFIPFTVKYYSELSPLSLLLTPIITPIFFAFFILSILAFISFPFENIIGEINNFLNKTLRIFNSFVPRIYVSPMSEIGILVFEIIFVLFLYYLSIKLKPMKNTTSAILISVLVLYILPINFLIKNYVTFINVGQGDSTLIKYNTSTVLIDTGGLKNVDVANEVLIPFFKKKQIYSIDLLITTHDDFDHSGALIPLVENFKVKRYEKDYLNFPININGLVLTNYNVYPELWSEENDESLVIGFNVNNFNYLVMGDAPTKIERAIIRNNSHVPCDILKVGHHGSKTSSCDEFIKFLKPTVAVISCGKNNYYGHPHSEVIAILKKYHVSIRRTDKESSITF